MGEVPHGVRGANSQSGHFYARERRRSHVDPTLGLFKTHDLPVVGVLTTSTLFPAPVNSNSFTIALDFISKTAGAITYTLGGVGGSRLAISISGVDLVASAGSGTIVGDRVILDQTGVFILDKLQRLVMSVIPGTGKGKIWLDGVLISSAFAANGEFNGPWADATDGSAVVVTSNLNKAQAYVNQLPRQF